MLKAYDGRGVGEHTPRYRDAHFETKGAELFASLVDAVVVAMVGSEFVEFQRCVLVTWIEFMSDCHIRSGTLQVW